MKSILTWLEQTSVALLIAPINPHKTHLGSPYLSLFWSKNASLMSETSTWISIKTFIEILIETLEFWSLTCQTQWRLHSLKERVNYLSENTQTLNFQLGI